MGKRDIGGREPKKAKKDAKKKAIAPTIVNTSTPVEVIRKERKKRAEEEED
ncbi:MAG: hypothetical protein JW712_06495 [Dehalococcoidales bacterium]|nr:hypothetical protein [Dehalococcoidales bacterium]